MLEVMQSTIRLDKIDQSLSIMRLIRPEQVSSMVHSLETSGQLQPVIVRQKGSLYQIIDGFKRYYATEKLQLEQLNVQIFDVDDITAKTMILSYNRQGNSLLDYEEAQIIYSLKKDHLMKTEEIATLLSRSYSWVSRRLSLVERLDEVVLNHLRLGEISVTHARELIKLPRGTQNKFLKVIIDKNLTSRQATILIYMYLQSKKEEEQNYMLKHPIEAIEGQNRDLETGDCRLSNYGNRLLKSSRILARSQQIFIGQCSEAPLNEFTAIELEILSEPLTDILRKAKIIQSILKKYDNNERRSIRK